MADKISASVTYLDATNNKGTKAITDISPTADNGAIRNFCVGLFGLTTNTLSQIDRVEKTDITNATTKPKLTLQLDAAKVADGKLQYNSDNTRIPLQIFKNPNSVPPFTYKTSAQSSSLYQSFCVGVNQEPEPDVDGTVTIYAFLYWADSDPASDLGGYDIDFYFDETATTAATHYRLTINYNTEPTLTQL